MKSIQIWVNHFFYGLWNSWITKEIKQHPNIRPAINDVLDIINPWAKRTTKRHISNDSRQHSDTNRCRLFIYVAFNFIQRRKDENEIENRINKVNCINICTSLINEVSNRKAIRLVDVGWWIRRHPSTMKSWRHYPVERKRQSTDVLQLIVDRFLFRVFWLDEPVHNFSLITPINSKKKNSSYDSYLFEIFLTLTVAT